MGAASACERNHWGLRWSSPWGHGTCEECADMGAAGACERSHWGLRWNSRYGATKRARGVPRWLT
eukprot:5374215-Pyramimonas_sp.AAC.1